MDEQNGKSKEEEVMREGRGESKMEELVPEWGRRREKGNFKNCSTKDLVRFKNETNHIIILFYYTD